MRPKVWATAEIFERQRRVVLARHRRGLWDLWTLRPLHSVFLRRLANFRLGKGHIALEGDLPTYSLLALDLRRQQFGPVVNAGPVTRAPTCN